MVSIPYWDTQIQIYQGSVTTWPMDTLLVYLSKIYLRNADWFIFISKILLFVIHMSKRLFQWAISGTFSRQIWHADNSGSNAQLWPVPFPAKIAQFTWLCISNTLTDLNNPVTGLHFSRLLSCECAPSLASLAPFHSTVKDCSQRREFSSHNEWHMTLHENAVQAVSSYTCTQTSEFKMRLKKEKKKKEQYIHDLHHVKSFNLIRSERKNFS